MKTTAAQNRKLAEIKENGYAIWGAGSRATVMALAKAGLVKIERRVIPTWPGHPEAGEYEREVAVLP